MTAAPRQAANEAIVPFTLAIGEAQLQDLCARLDQTRWPEAEPVDDWSQGVPLNALQALTEYWRNDYDWRRCEARLNELNQFTTAIDGVDIHFLHIRSGHEHALPLLLTHGWPGSVLEFRHCIEPLIAPEKHGGTADEAFHLVVPSLPGHGFSGKPQTTGWSVPHIAQAWQELMRRLGYTRYVAQGGDWGAAVTTAMGVQQPPELAAIHLNYPLVIPRDMDAESTEDEARCIEQLAWYRRWDNGYAVLQSSRPQTLGYALADSPIGQAAWIYEKLQSWTQNNGLPEDALSRDEILDNIMLYWLPNTAAASGRLYWESFRKGFSAVELSLPTACSVFPHDIYTAPRSWAERCIHNLIYWNELDQGGHFAAWEQPGIFVDELRKAFWSIRF